LDNDWLAFIIVTKGNLPNKDSGQLIGASVSMEQKVIGACSNYSRTLWEFQLGLCHYPGQVMMSDMMKLHTFELDAQDLGQLLDGEGDNATAGDEFRVFGDRHERYAFNEVPITAILIPVRKRTEAEFQARVT
jgi:hypothetical protein